MMGIPIYESITGKYFKRSLLTTAIVMAGLPQLTLAQTIEQSQGGKQQGVLEEVVVTGSNIRRKRDYETPSPIQTMDMEMVSSAGAGQVQDLLKALPANAGSELNASQSDRQGTSQFSLRGLGVGGTLTLINGRRGGLSAVTTGQGFFFTDVNQYPTNMIQSVEVLLDGASATYGSEAVGGVVNVITRKNFEGFEIGAEYRDNENTPAGQLNAAFGTSFDGGHFTTFVNYYTQERGLRGDYSWLTNRSDAFSTDAKANLYDSSTGAGRYNRAVDPDGDGFYSREGNTVADPNCGSPNPINGVVNTFLSGDNCRYQFINQRTLIAEENRFQVFSQFDYDLTDSVKIFSEMSFSSNEIKDTIGGAVMDQRLDDGGHYVSGAHPFNYFVDNGGTLSWDPEAVAADPSSAVDVIFRGRPLTTFDGELGDDITRKFDNTRIVMGFDADLSEAWSVYGSYMYARSNLTDVQPRSYNTAAFRAAIDSGRWNPFASGWATPDAVSVKDNVTTAGNSLSGANSDLNLFTSHRTFIKETTQHVAEVILSGDAYELSNGNVIVAAVGAQYRDTRFRDIADSLSTFRLDGRTDPVFSIPSASQDVYAFFAEADVPISDSFNMQLALRYEDYGDQGGDTTDPKLGLKFTPTDALLFRTSIGTSFQAPSIRNIEGSVGSGALADPITAAVFNAGAGSACDSEVTDSFNSAQITTGGGLTPQSALNWNLGAVYQTDNMTASIDFWTYEFEDLIGPGAAFGAIISGECRNGVYVPDSRVGRNSSGQLSQVSTEFINLGGVETNGIDVAAKYVFDDVAGGELTADAKMTYINTFDIDFGNGEEVFNGAGNRNSFIDLLGSVPDFRVNLGVSWRDESQNAGLYIRHIGAYEDRTPSKINPSISSNTVLDFQYGIALDGLLGDGSTDVTFGINNLTDEVPPAIGRGSVNGRVGFDQQVHDPRGRIAYLRLKHTF